ncbi:MAG: efflux RND transporter periplasmic adaptor subunit [Thiotrichaceae bacterium]|nr:efflux RND transporter periplasmic adaptor subunit [Thiotrichaceae bacterium]
MRVIVIVLICLNSIQLFANQKIKLSETQLYNLGIKLGKAEVISSVPLMDAPAKVTIPPANEYIVSTSHAGLVNEILVTVGDEVEKGQLLAIINSPDLLTLQQHHLQSVNELKLARTDFLRDQKLYKEGVIADRRWLKTQANYHVFVSHLNETRQLLSIAGLSKQDIKQLEKKHILNSQLSVVAPISGVILARYMTTGERVDALAPLFQVANLNKLWLDISIPQQRINLVRLGDKVAVQGMNVTARIFLLGKNVDYENQTVLVRAEIDSGLESIRPGQTVNAQISQSSTNAMFKVPNSALAQYLGVNYVFLRTKTGFMAQPVQVLGREARKTIITGEIQKNSEIALRGAVALKANFLGLGGDE